jgi:3-isopropylmalate dehydrogenase
MHRIAFIPGDGVGLDVAAEAGKVLQVVIDRSGLDLQVEHYDHGAQKYLNDGITIPDELVEEFRRHYAAIFIGALGDSRVADGIHVKEILSKLRLKLDLYVNYRPIKLFNSKYCPLKDKNADDVDFVVLRENLEGISATLGGSFRAGTVDEEIVQQAIVSRHGIVRIVRHAFEFARRSGRRELTLCSSRGMTNSNINLWQSVLDEFGSEFNNVDIRTESLQTVLGKLLRRPGDYDLIISCSLLGDVIADIGAELQGGIGLAVEGNVNPGKISLFRPVHGPMNDKAGSNVVNPLGAISAISMMLEHLGFDQEARWVSAAVGYALDTDNTTSDLGGRLSTMQVGDFIADQIKKGAH